MAVEDIAIDGVKLRVEAASARLAGAFRRQCPRRPRPRLPGNPLASTILIRVQYLNCIEIAMR